MKMRPNAMASAWPCAIAASAVSPVKPPAEIKTPRQSGRNSTIADGTFWQFTSARPAARAARPSRARLDETQIGKPQRIERLDHKRVKRQWIGLAAAVGNPIGRQAN